MSIGYGPSNHSDDGVRFIDLLSPIMATASAKLVTLERLSTSDAIFVNNAWRIHTPGDSSLRGTDLLDETTPSSSPVSPPVPRLDVLPV